jgi:hypothetical protein
MGCPAKINLLSGICGMIPVPPAGLGPPSVPAGDVAVVGVGSAIVLPPEVVLAGRKADPGQEPLGGQLGPLRPLAHVIDHFVTRVGGNPASLQGPPLAFFPGRCPP